MDKKGNATHCVTVKFDKRDNGRFVLVANKKTLAYMKVKLVGSYLVLVETVSSVRNKLSVFGSCLLLEVLQFARMHVLKIITISTFARKKFSSHPLLYEDVWEKVDY